MDIFLLYVTSSALYNREYADGKSIILFIENELLATILTIVSSACLLPLSYLLIVQTKNFFANKTTSEKYSKGASQESVVEVKHSWYQNFYLMCCNKGEGSYSGPLKSFADTTLSKSTDYQMMIEDSA